MSMEETIHAKLKAGLSPDTLDVANESHLHAGHQGSPGTGESHFRVQVVAAAFAGRSRLERHRMINELLAEELTGSIHALAIRAKAPDEVA